MAIRSLTPSTRRRLSIANDVIEASDVKIIYLSRDRTTFYGVSAISTIYRVLKKSTDGGVTWTTIRTWATPNTSSVIEGMLELPNGEVLLYVNNTACAIWKSSGWVANPATCTFTQVHQMPHAQVYNFYAIHDDCIGTNGVIIASEAGPQTPVAAGVTYTNRGTGYTWATLEGIGGTGADIRVNITDGTIARIAIFSGGTGYTAGNFTITGDGSGAVISYTVTGGVITSMAQGWGSSARFLYLSEDFGDTWNLIFDIFTTPAYKYAQSVHLHGICYDESWDRIWLTFGDNTGDSGKICGPTNTQIAYSDDRGATWNYVPYETDGGTLVYQYTAIATNDFGIYLSTDAQRFIGIQVYKKTGYRQFDPAQYFTTGHDVGSNTVGRTFRKAYSAANTQPMFLTYSDGAAVKIPRVYASIDGANWQEFYADPDQVTRPLVAGAYIQEFFGPDTNNRLVTNYSYNGTWLRVRGTLVFA